MTADRDVSRETRDRLLDVVAHPDQLTRFHDILAVTGVERGLIGPREAPRLWDRHLANSAVVALREDLVPPGSRVIDVGSGAGLPGIVWALVRSDLRLTLVEPLLRRYTFLSDVTRTLGVTERVDVVRARAEDVHGDLSAEVVTARAVAPLKRLVGWTLPLVSGDGRLVALKGSSAHQEIEDARSRIQELGGTESRVLEVGQDITSTPTTVIVIDRRA